MKFFFGLNYIFGEKGIVGSGNDENTVSSFLVYKNRSHSTGLPRDGFYELAANSIFEEVILNQRTKKVVSYRGYHYNFPTQTGNSYSLVGSFSSKANLKVFSKNSFPGFGHSISIVSYEVHHITSDYSYSRRHHNTSLDN